MIHILLIFVELLLVLQLSYQPSHINKNDISEPNIVLDKNWGLLSDSFTVDTKYKYKTLTLCITINTVYDNVHNYLI